MERKINYKLIFSVEILAFLSISAWAVAMEGPTGGIFGRQGFNVFGINLSADFWIFFVMVPLFLLLPLIAKGFKSKLFGILAAGAFIGTMLEDFFWFVINPHFGLSKFNSTYATWLSWIRVGALELPYFYPLAIFAAAVIWFVFIKNSEKVDKFLMQKGFKIKI